MPAGVPDQTMDFPRELNAGYCIVDMPQVKGYSDSRIEVMSKIAYIHGTTTTIPMKKLQVGCLSSRN